MPGNMAAEAWNHQRFSILFRRFNFFPTVVVINNSLDCPVDARRVVQFSKAVTEDEPTHTIKLDYIAIAVLPLVLLLKIQGFLYLIQHRDCSYSRFRLRFRYLELALEGVIRSRIV